MNTQIRIAVIIPAGPGDNVLDTLASVLHYTDPSRVIVVIDDSSMLGEDLSRVRDLSPDVVVIPAPPGLPGRRGRLWLKVTAAYRWLLDRYEPGLTLRMDADALLIGHGLETAAEHAFARSPGVGLLGSYRIGPDGGQRDFSTAAGRLRAETGARGLIRPRYRSALRSQLRLARSHGYTSGEHVLGSACLHSGVAVRRMYDLGLFSQPWLAKSQLADDHIMALLTVAAGFRLGDFGGPDDPLALRWRGLPAHPHDLLAAGKLATHSVRFWQDLSESEVRAWFARVRTADSDVPLHTQD